LTLNKVAQFLGDKEYTASEAQQWSTKLSEQLILELKELSGAFKFCVTCVIMQRLEAGLHISSTCYWDTMADGSLTVRWDSKSMYCIINIFALAL
jgi:dynein light chain Tctex-type 1